MGRWCNPHGNRLHYLRHNGPEHILAFAPTRSGKGVGLVIPTLLAWSESAVVYDSKGENWAKTAGFRQAQGHVCFKFSPVEIGNGSRFNPLSEVRIGTPRDVSDAQNVADMIFRTGEDSPQERYWQDAAASITTGMILHVCYATAAEGKVACLSDLASVFTKPGQSFRDTLAELENFPHDPSRSHGWRMPEGERAATHHVVREKVREMLDKEDKDFSGVLSTAKTALTLYSDPLVSRNASASDFTIDDLTMVQVIGGRPPLVDFHRQNSRNPLRCQLTKVSGLTAISALRQSNRPLRCAMNHRVGSSARWDLILRSLKKRQLLP